MISDKQNKDTDNGGFVSRWSRLKHEAKKQHEEPQHNAELQPSSSTVQRVLTDADMPPIDELTAESDYAGFLSPEVSEELRKLALRKLFHGAEFNIRDGLDDYDSDYTRYTKLGDIITADMKHQMEMEARKALASEQEERAAIAAAEDEQTTTLEHASDGMSETRSEGETEQQFTENLFDDDPDLQSEL